MDDIRVVIVPVDEGVGMGVYYTPEKKDWGFSLGWSF